MKKVGRLLYFLYFEILALKIVFSVKFCGVFPPKSSSSHLLFPHRGKLFIDAKSYDEMGPDHTYYSKVFIP